MMIQYFLLTCLAQLYLRVHKSNIPGLSPALRDLLYIALRHYRPCSSLHGNKDAGKQKYYCLLHCVISNLHREAAVQHRKKQSPREQLLEATKVCFIFYIDSFPFNIQFGYLEYLPIYQMDPGFFRQNSCDENIIKPEIILSF